MNEQRENIRFEPCHFALEQLFDILRWSAQQGLIATHNDRPLDQIRMFRHEGDQFFIQFLPRELVLLFGIKVL